MSFSFRWGVDLFDNERTPIPNWILLHYHQVEWRGIDEQGKPISGVGISNTEMVFIIHLASFKYESEKGQASPSLTGTIAKRMNYKSNQGIINIKESLIRKGLLLVEKRPGLTSIYDFTPFSQAIIKAAQSSTKVDESSSTKVDESSSTKVDESRQQKLTRRKEEKENLEEKEGKKERASPALADSGDPADLPDAKAQMAILFPSCGSGNVRDYMQSIQIAGWEIPNVDLRRAAALFLKHSGLPIPNSPSTRKDWIKDLTVHVDDFGVSVLERLYPLVIAKMRKGHLNVGRPGSVTNMLSMTCAELKEQTEFVPIESPDPPDPLLPHEQLWKQVLADMRLQMTEVAFAQHLAGTYALARDDGILHIGVDDPLTQDWIEQRLADKILAVVQGIDERVREIAYELH